MKRKLIAVALAFAMVLSMVPSLAFADEVAIPTLGGFTDMIKALDAYDKDADSPANDFEGMKFADYKTAYAKLVAFEDAYKALEDKIAAKDEYSAKEIADAEALKTEVDKIGVPATYRGLYDAQIVTYVEADAAKIIPVGKEDAAYDDPAAAVKALAPLYEALDTTKDQTGLDKVEDVELAIFLATVYDEITGFCDFDVSGATATIITMPGNAAIEAAVAAYPQYAELTGLGDVISAITTADKETKFEGIPAAGGANVTLTAAGIESAYNVVVGKYNEANLDAFDKAMKVVNGYVAAEDAAKLAESIKAARAAYAAIVADENNMPPLTGLWTAEAKYVDLLTHKDATINEKNADAFAAATAAARAALDELEKYYEKAGETGDVATVKAKIEQAESDINDYYVATVKTAYDAVKSVTEVTAENKADVDAFVKAYANYETTLTTNQKKAIADGTDKIGAAYAAKYAELKALVEAYVSPEDAEIAQLKAELEALKADKDANAAQIAELSAKIAFLDSKVAGVKVKVGKKKATISWKAVDGAAKYKVYRATSKNGKFKAVKTTAKVKFTNKKLKSGKAYFYKVVAVDAAGDLSKDSKIVKSKKVK